MPRFWPTSNTRRSWNAEIADTPTISGAGNMLTVVSHSPMFVKGKFIVPFRTNTDSKLTVLQTDLLSIIKDIPE